VTLAVVPAVIAAMRSQAAHRERLAYHARLGRFSAQMAHDLKNPLAAVKGAAQLLLRGQERGQPLPDAGEYLRLIVDQIDRVSLVISDYQRLGRVDPALETISLNELVRSVLALQPLAAPAGVRVNAELGEALPPCLADPALIARVVENLVRNAFEAMPQGGTVTVRTGSLPSSQVWVSVEDTGVGMDARLREQVFDEFFTTKSQGSGLGLALVKRVADAHGGEVQLQSDEGRGTTIRVLLRSAPTPAR
jgi:two-component system, NtrC family, sensor histidine kinase HydH